MSAPNFQIRRYLPPDHARVMELHVLGLEQFGVNAPHGEWDADMNDIEGEYLSEGGDFLVGEVNGHVVAMGALRRKDSTTAEVKRMRVHPDHQARGYGQAILDELTERAKALGYSRLVLDTTSRMLPAQKLYLKNGFVEVAREKRRTLEIIFFEKNLLS